MVLSVANGVLITIDASLAMFIVGVLLPIVVGIITKLSAPSWLKAVLHMLFAAVASLIITSITLDGTAVISKTSALIAFGTWITGMATYFGFLMPSGISPAVNTKTARIGIG